MNDRTIKHVYVHRTCGGPAFYLPVKPEAGAIAASRGVVYPDGTPVEWGSEIKCGTCGKYMGRLNLGDVMQEFLN